MRRTACAAVLLLGFALAGCKGAAYQPYNGPEGSAGAQKPAAQGNAGAREETQTASTAEPEPPPERNHVSAGDVGKGAKTKIVLTSRSFANRRPIPSSFTCDGFDGAPDLSWTGVPPGTAALAITMEDPKGPKGAFMHWTMFNIKPSITSLAAGQVPRGAVQGENDFHQIGYGGPCPSYTQSTHRYVFTLYALKAQISLTEGASPQDVRDEIDNAALAKGRLTGTYRRRS